MSERHDLSVAQLSADFQRRYDAAFSWSRDISMHLGLPVLRGYWPLTSVFYTAAAGVAAADLSGQGNHLSNNNVVFYYSTTGLPGFGRFVPAANGRLYRADGGAGNWADIIGTEAYVAAAQRGLTLGVWVNVANLPGATAYFISKVGGAGDRSYALATTAANQAYFTVWSAAGAQTGVAPATALTAGQWTFLAGRFVPGGNHSVWVDGVRTDAAGAPASLFDSTADFTLGAISGGGNYIDAYMHGAFLCACALSNAQVLSLYEQTRAMFGR